jgi:tellurite methyltransferase
MTTMFGVADYFDDLYSRYPRYWWRGHERYSPRADDYADSLLTQMTLRLIADAPAGRVLDIGAGEGADSIRLALLGHDVHAVELSPVAADKIARFAAEIGASVKVDVADITEYEPEDLYDLIICNGVLHYVEDKAAVVRCMQAATRPGGRNVISLWSTYTEVPDCHASVPVFCDDEDGVVAGMYRPWIKELHYVERDKPEKSHSEMPPHSHSHIKLIARKP